MSTNYDTFYSEVRLAFEKYLLQYQNYNANYTAEENKLLGYPNPIAAVYSKHQYSRFAYEQFAQALPFEIKTPYLICNKRVITTLQSLYPNISIYSMDDDLPAKVEKTWVAHLDVVLEQKHCPEKVKKIWFAHLNVALEQKDCPEEIEEPWVAHPDIALNKKYCPEKTVKKAVQKFFKSKIFQELSQKNKIQCIATVGIENIDFSLVFSGRVNKGKNGYGIEFQTLSKIFDSNVGSLISNTGTIPDRMALIDFVAAISPKTPSDDLNRNSVAVPLWESAITRIQNKSFASHPGCELLRSVILKWHDSFFNDPVILRFAKPLLSTQVAPFMDESENITQWAKAYQNLCEVVIFCLESFPEKFEHLSYEKKVEDFLSQYKCRASVGLFPYAMTGIFYFLNHILTKLSSTEKSNFFALYLGSNYFETIEVIEKTVCSKNFESREISLLEEIQEVPNILIADIHPNNAARSALFQNDFSSLRKLLEENREKELTLILDVTLNHLDDPHLEHTLSMLSPFVQSGQLTILGVQSLAKLMQFGADNFSGGLAFCLTSEEKTEAMPTFTSSIRRKSAFFALTHDLFKDNASEYINLVRRNTNTTYKILQDLFIDIEKQNTHKGTPFCAAELIQNTDENTVYVAINFSPLLETFYADAKEKVKERYVNMIRKMLLAYSAEHGLHLTGRQSFGFTLSNMSSVCEAIRLSIGIESEEELLSQCHLIATFIEALTKYHSEYKTDTPNLTHFKEKFSQALSLTYEDESYSKEFNFFEEGCDIDANDILIPLGNGTVKCENQQIILSTDQHTNILELSPFDRLLFNFSLVAKENDSRWLQINRFDDDKLALFPEDRCRLFRNDQSDFDAHSKLKIQYSPFKINQLTADQIYIKDEHSGETPVRIEKLQPAAQNRIFTKIHRYYIELQPHEQDCVLIQFSERKEFFDYGEKIRTLLKEDLNKDLTPLISWLSSLDFDHLPLEHDADWRQWSNSKNTLMKFLRLIGHELTSQFHNFLENIETIQDLKLKTFLFEGVRSYLATSTSPLNDKAASAIKNVLRSNLFSTYDNFDFLTHWILGQEIKDQPLSTFEILFPLIKSTFTSLGQFNSITTAEKLKAIAKEKNCRLINEYFLELEESCLKKIDRPNFCLKLFIRYPFTKEQKKKLVERVKELDTDQWLHSPKFFFYGIGQDRLDYGHCNWPEDETMFYESEREDINTFLAQTGLLDRLLYLAQENNLSLRRWYQITEHPSMFLSAPF